MLLTKAPKIAVYAISKNEEAFVERFCVSAKEADYLVIADTGSTDRTVGLAMEYTPNVYSIAVQPWRFDHARNTSLALVPADANICICLDLDEVLVEGWRAKVLDAWSADTTRLRYKFSWSPELTFYSDKIHSREGYTWKHPCHELLYRQDQQADVWGVSHEVLVEHYPDNSKSRSSYLDLLRLGVEEDPTCPRNSFYYARELATRGFRTEAVTELIRYLALPTAVWEVERAYAMRVLGNTLYELGQHAQGLQWLRRACAEDPNHRESWFHLTRKYYNLGQWEHCYACAKELLSITTLDYVYTTEASCWGSDPYDYAAISAYHLGLKSEAVRYGEKALELGPNNQRLLSNLGHYHEVLRNSSTDS